MKRCVLAGLSVLVWTLTFVLPVMAETQGRIELKVVAEQEKMVLNSEGKKEMTRVPVARVIPGDEVIYTLHYANKGQEPAENVDIIDPVPEHMTYTEGSAFGEATTITFSVDNGATYDIPANLAVKGEDGKKRPAIGSDYTHIRWVLNKPLASGEKGLVSFRARLN